MTEQLMVRSPESDNWAGPFTTSEIVDWTKAHLTAMRAAAQLRRFAAWNRTGEHTIANGRKPMLVVKLHVRAH